MQTQRRDVRTREGRGGGVNWEIGTVIYTRPCVEKILSGSCCGTQGAQQILGDSLEGWHRVGCGREVQEGEDTCVLMADPPCCIAETNTPL